MTHKRRVSLCNKLSHTSIYKSGLSRFNNIARTFLLQNSKFNTFLSKQKRFVDAYKIYQKWHSEWLSFLSLWQEQNFKNGILRTILLYFDGNVFCWYISCAKKLEPKCSYFTLLSLIVSSFEYKLNGFQINVLIVVHLLLIIFQDRSRKAQSRRDSASRNLRSSHRVLLRHRGLHHALLQEHTYPDRGLTERSLHVLWWHHWEAWRL